MLNNDAANIELYPTQWTTQLVNANTTYCLWQRGGGKTGGGIGPRIQRLSELMPRSQSLLFSDTYERLQDRIVPNIIEFQTNKLGLIEGVDFVMYKKPPDNWPKPIFPLNKFDKVISYSTGFALCLVSLHVEGSANAFNAQSGTGDEVKYCDEEKIDSEVLPALRGCEKEFGHLPEYLSIWMFTDKYGPKVKWLLRKKKLVNQRAVDIVLKLQYEILRLEEEKKKYTSPATLAKYNATISEYKTKADRIRKNLIYYSDMKPYENLKSLGEQFFRRAKRIAKTEYIFNVAFLNHDPDKIEHTYYPTFTKYNKYQSNNDYNRNESFLITLDYQWRISPMPVVQMTKLPGRTQTSINFIDALYVLHPLGLVDVVNNFCIKYKDHLKKEVYYIHDHTSIGKTPTKKVFSDVVIDAFKDNGWIVIPKYIGDAPDQDLKFENIKPWLLNRAENAVMVNEVTAEQMIRSIELTPAKTVSSITKKDKSSERNLNFPAEDSTHFSDAFDQMLWGIFEHNVRPGNAGSGIPISIG